MQSAGVKTIEYAYVVTTLTWGKFLPCSWQYLSPIDKKWILGDLVYAQYLASPTTVAIPFLFLLEVLYRHLLSIYFYSLAVYFVVVIITI